MKTFPSSRKNPLALAGLALGSLLFAGGCLFSGETEVAAETEIQGVLEGDASSGSGVMLGKSAAEVEGAVVTLHEVSLDGGLGEAVAETRTEADGSFVLKTGLTGARTLVIRIVREGREWKAAFEDRLERGRAKVVGAVNLETTVDAEVWLELKKTAEGRAALAAEIRAAVEAHRDSAGLNDFRGSDTAKSRLIARLAHAVMASADARGKGVADLMLRVEAALRADSLRADSGDTVAIRIHPRPVLTPCERAAVTLAGMAETDSGYAALRARFAAHCLEAGDEERGVPVMGPGSPIRACSELSARLEWMDEDAPQYAALRLRVAAFCGRGEGAEPPPPLTRCERAAVRLAAMAETDPAYVALKARYENFCLDEDESNDDDVDAG